MRTDARASFHGSRSKVVKAGDELALLVCARSAGARVSADVRHRAGGSRRRCLHRVYTKVEALHTNPLCD